MLSSRAACTTTDLVNFLFAGDDGQMTSEKAERLKVNLGKLVQQLLQLEHSTFRVLRLVCFYHQLIELCGTQNIRLIEQGLTSHQTHYRSYRGRFYGSNDQTNSVKALKEDRSKGLGFNPIRSTPPCSQPCSVKHDHTNKSTHSEIGPVRQNPIQRTVRTAHLSKCAYDCAQLQYTIQHRTVLIISPLTSRQTS